MGESPRIDRVSADDLMSLVAERGSTPLQVGAVLTLDARSGLDPVRAIDVLARRITAVPRLRQRLVDVPFGCGRPAWGDDAAFAITNHVTSVRCPEPGGEQAALGLAAGMIVEPLQRDRPLWTATLVTDTAPGEAALIIVFHHVLADGIGGLAVLASLVDGAAEPRFTAFPRPGPSVRQLAVDAAGGRIRSLRRLPAALRRIGSAVAELRPAGRVRAVRTSLTRPTGPRRSFASIRVDLEQLRTVAHARHATVNDAVMSAIGGALHRLLELRGERADEFVFSVPFSARRQASAGDLGNQSGVIPLAIPGIGDPAERLEEVAAVTRAAKRAAPGASTAVLGPLFRLLARVGLYQRFINRQRLIHTFVTNLRGPETRQTIFGCPITGIIPLTVASGDVTVSFAVLSYAGTLAVTINADPDACPDLPELRQALADELGALAAPFAV